MIRFPSFRPTSSCEDAKTAQQSLQDILTKWPGGAAAEGDKATLTPSGSMSSSSFTSTTSSLANASSDPVKHDAADYKWISTPHHHQNNHHHHHHHDGHHSHHNHRHRTRNSDDKPGLNSSTSSTKSRSSIDSTASKG